MEVLTTGRLLPGRLGRVAGTDPREEPDLSPRAEVPRRLRRSRPVRAGRPHPPGSVSVRARRPAHVHAAGTALLRHAPDAWRLVPRGAGPQARRRRPQGRPRLGARPLRRARIRARRLRSWVSSQCSASPPLPWPAPGDEYGPLPPDSVFPALLTRRSIYGGRGGAAVPQRLRVFLALALGVFLAVLAAAGSGRGRDRAAVVRDARAGRRRRPARRHATPTAPGRQLPAHPLLRDRLHARLDRRAERRAHDGRGRSGSRPSAATCTGRHQRARHERSSAGTSTTGSRLREVALTDPAARRRSCSPKYGDA